MSLDIKNNAQYKRLHDGMVHFVLSHSYMVFMLAVVIGLLFHTMFSFRVFNSVIYKYIGIIMILSGSWFIYWAQSTSGRVHKNIKNITEKYFEHGPYKYTRNPTHLGLSIMVIGLGFLINSISVIIFVTIASFITKFIFLKKEEDILEVKYGQAYRDYKKKIKTWV